MAHWIRRINPTLDGERFVLAQTRGTKNGTLNYWHLKDGHVYLYTFWPNQKFNKRSIWSRELCQELEGDLRSSKPSVKVIRFAVDDQLIFVEEGRNDKNIPQMPKPTTFDEGWVRHLEKQARKAMREELQKSEGWDRHLERVARKKQTVQRAELEAVKGQEKAPYWLYGKFAEDGPEYIWKLTPDKPKRQGIQPGDRVLAWTQKGFAKVYCTRIERVDMRRKQPEHPKYRVKKKLE